MAVPAPVKTHMGSGGSSEGPKGVLSNVVSALATSSSASSSGPSKKVEDTKSQGQDAQDGAPAALTAASASADKSGSTQGASAANHAPSNIQFDEASLLSSPPRSGNRLPSPASEHSKLHSATERASVGNTSGGAGPNGVGSTAGQSNHTFGGLGLGLSQVGRNHRGSELSLGGTTSYASSVRDNRAEGSSSGTPHGTLNRSKISTRPPWARNDPPSPPTSPPVRASHGAKPSELSLEARPQARGAASPQKPDSTESPQVGRPRSESDDSDGASSSGEPGPTRFWTFTLPAKYRARLHSHHLRMQQSSQTQTHTQTEEESRDSSIDQGEHLDGGRERSRRASGTGVAGGAGRQSAAELAGSGLMGWRRKSAKGSQELKEDDAPLSPTSQEGRWPSSAGSRSGKRGQEQSDEAPSPNLPDATMNAHIKSGPVHQDSFTRHQPHTPGWESPWRPETYSGGSIEIGRYRFGGHDLRGEKMERHDTSPRLDWWRNFLLHNAFVPGLFRFINIGFTSATLAIAIRLYVVLKQQAAADSVGSSPLVAIIFGPPTLLHVGWQIYLEYFGKPIGLWAVRNKLLYSLVDLVFICMWSAELSLSFDNYLTSSLVCVADINPFAGLETQSPLTDPAKKPIICRLQGTLIGLVFVSLIAYVIVLVLSLFRIFVRVSGPRTKGTYA